MSLKYGTASQICEVVVLKSMGSGFRGWWGHPRVIISQYFSRGLDLLGFLPGWGTRFEGLGPPWRQPRGKLIVSLVNSHINATRIGWHVWEIDLRFAPGLPPGWIRVQG